MLETDAVLHGGAGGGAVGGDSSNLPKTRESDTVGGASASAAFISQWCSKLRLTVAQF